MITTADYLIRVVAEGETYMFEYDAPDVWTAMEEFWHDDWNDRLSHKAMTKAWPMDVMAMDGGKVIATYNFAFEMSHFHHYYDHGDITLDEFDKAIRVMRADLDGNLNKTNL